MTEGELCEIPSFNGALREREIRKNGGGRGNRKGMLSPREESVREGNPQNRVKCSQAGWTQKDRAPGLTRRFVL